MREKNFKPSEQAKQEIKEIEIPGLGVIKYGTLTVEDFQDILNAKNEFEAATLMLHHMLRKADPTISLEEIKKMPIWTFMCLSKHLLFPLAKQFKEMSLFFNSAKYRV